MLTVVNKGVNMISKSTEEYLKTIYVLMKQNDIVRVTDIASKMNCSKPSVTKQLSILKENGLINYESYGKIELTKKGIDVATHALADYDILYILLHDVIGIDEELSKSEAAKIKSVIDEDALNKISDYINIKFGLDKLKCNFNIRKEECRMCAFRGKEINYDRTNRC
jgi:DtxR family Mn-dependent transcriptional regulator